jgi:dolichol-phosphate mannosyltransferase
MDTSCRSGTEVTRLEQHLPGRVQLQPQLSVIVPTRNEARNVGPLLKRVRAATQGLVTEVIFVDDSTDNTPTVIENEGKHSPLEVSLIARPLERRNGLGKAVVEGMRAAKADWVCVVDGDLQHPPEVIPQLLHHAYATNTTLVAASRLTEGGSTAGLSLRRKVISYALAFGSRLVFSQQLRKVTDPLTGFFLFRRDMVNPDDLQPEGFKILLEVLVRSPRLRVSELPFEFAERNTGESKANSNEAVKLFRQMLRLSLSSQAHLLRFIAVGLTGLGVNTLLMGMFTEGLGLLYILSAILATQGSSLWNFTLTETWVFAERREDGRILHRLLGYMTVNNGALLLRGPLLVFFVSWLSVHYLVANLLSLVMLMLLRYFIADRFIWRKQAASELPLTPVTSVHTEKL